MGGEVRQYRVAPHPPALRALGVSYQDVDQSLMQFGTNAGGGFTDLHAREYLIRNIGRTTSLDDLRNIVVAKVEGKPVYLRQVASVDYAPKVRRGDSGYMGKPAVVVSVEKQPNVDTVALTRQLEEAVAGLNAHLPHGIKADQVIFRQANFIETSIRNVPARYSRSRDRRVRRAVRVPPELAYDRDLADRDPGFDPGDGCGFLLSRAYHQHHEFIWAASPSPLVRWWTTRWSMSKTFSVACEKTARPAIPVRRSMLWVAASQEVRSGILYASIIIVLVFVPLFALTGIEGRLFTPLGQAYIVAILG